ncbi:hypothetical protein BC827DRAFT_1156714 [Russula dissimulans]|nr:hypothetical protein BC827DRAFT_1156714 [Russula dissimulans]
MRNLNHWFRFTVKEQSDLGCSFTVNTVQNPVQAAPFLLIANPPRRHPNRCGELNAASLAMIRHSILHTYSEVSLDYFTGMNLRTSTYLVAQQDFLDPWYTPTPPLTTVDSVAPSLGDASWPVLSQSPPETAAGTQDLPVSSGPNTLTTVSLAELAWTFDPGLFTTVSFGYIVDKSVAAQVAPEYSESFFKFVGPVVEPCIPTGSVTAGLIVPDHGAAVVPVPEITTLPQRVLGKRRRGVYDALSEGNQDINHGHRPSPRKKGKPKMATTAGVLEANKPAARTLANINRKSKVTETRSGEARDSERTGSFRSILAGTKCPVGVNGGDCAGRAASG